MVSHVGQRLQGDSAEVVPELLEDGLDPAHVAALVIGAIETRRLFVFTHAETRAAVERCHELMLQGLDALGETPQRKAV